jgi:ferredoxin-NADP reductase
VLLSAGVGATPGLAMLASLAAESSDREVWWIHGARNRAEHAFAEEVRRYRASLPRARSHIRYSRPDASDEPGLDYDAKGRVTLDALQDLGVPRAADYYLCGPTAWMRELSAGLLTWGAAPSGSIPRSSAPSRWRELPAPRTRRPAPAVPAQRSRSRPPG